MNRKEKKYEKRTINDSASSTFPLGPDLPEMGLEASHSFPPEARETFRAIGQWPRTKAVKAVHRLKEYPYHMLIDSATLMDMLDCDRKMAQDIIEFFGQNKR